MNIFKEKKVNYQEEYLSLEELKELLKIDDNINKIRYTRMLVDGKPVFQKENTFYYIDCTASQINNFIDDFFILNTQVRKKTAPRIIMQEEIQNVGYGINFPSLMYLLENKNAQVDQCLWILKMTEDSTKINIIPATPEEVRDAKNEVDKLNKYLMTKNPKSDYELVKIIHDYYLAQSYYWDPINYYGDILSYGIKLIHDRNRTCNHPDNFIGLIGSKHYATCEGLSDGLAGLFNYYGIDASIIGDKLHAITKLNLADGRVTYIDLARELSEYFADSLHSGYRRKSKEEQPKKNKNYCLVSKEKFKGKNHMEDFDKNISCNVEEELKNRRIVIHKKEEPKKPKKKISIIKYHNEPTITTNSNESNQTQSKETNQTLETPSMDKKIKPSITPSKKASKKPIAKATIAVTEPVVTTPKTNVENKDEYIPGTTILKPRYRGIYETDKEYEIYLKNYYDKYFPKQTQESSKTEFQKEELNAISQYSDEYIPGTNIYKPRYRDIYETDEEYETYLECYYNVYFPKQYTKKISSKRI